MPGLLLTVLALHGTLALMSSLVADPAKRSQLTLALLSSALPGPSTGSRGPQLTGLSLARGEDVDQAAVLPAPGRLPRRARIRRGVRHRREREPGVDGHARERQLCRRALLLCVERAFAGIRTLRRLRSCRGCSVADARPSRWTSWTIDGRQDHGRGHGTPAEEGRGRGYDRQSPVDDRHPLSSVVVHCASS